MPSNAAGDTSSPILASKLETVMITSPLLARVGDRFDNPFVETVVRDDMTGIQSVVYKAIITLRTVVVPAADFRKEIVINVEGPGWRKAPPSEDDGSKARKAR
jgi:hypothetical protein